MGQDEVLLVRDADFVVGVILGEIGDSVHLRRRCVARGAADRLQRDGDDDIARRLGGMTLCRQRAKRASLPLRRSTRSLTGCGRLKLGQREEGAEALDFVASAGQAPWVARGEFGLDRLADAPRRLSRGPES